MLQNGWCITTNCVDISVDKNGKKFKVNTHPRKNVN